MIDILRYHAIRPALLTLFLLFTATGLMAQNSSLSGVVTDPQGSVVPGIEVTLVNQATGATRTVIADDAGRYLFPQIRPGVYTIRAELTGFKTTVIQNVTLQVDVPKRLDLVLELGNISETVTVVSKGPAALNTVDATIGNAFDKEQVVLLPLNSRNVVNLLTLQPGVTAQGEVSGTRRDQSNLTLDGIDVNDQQQAGSQPGLDSSTPGNPNIFTPVLRITPDSVQEFRVTVTNPSASQGRSAGGQVSLITKAGTNNWHGSLYEYHRNTVTTANDFFNNRVVDSNRCPDGAVAGKDCALPRPALIRNLFGGSLGGPIIKDKAFFFFNYEGRRDRSQDSVLRTVPLPHLGQGMVKYDSSVTGERVTLTPADIARIYTATGGINPASTAVFAAAAKAYPPNDNGAGDQINTDGYRFNASTPLNQNTYIAKFDFNLSQKQTAYVRLNYDWDTQSTAPRFPDTPSPSVWSHPKGIAAVHTWTINPKMVNTFRYGLTRQAYSRQGDSATNAFSWRAVLDPFHYQRTLSRVTPSHNLVNEFSWIRGKHTLSFGVNFRFIDNERQSFGSAYDSFSSNAFAYPPGSLESLVGDVSRATRDPFRHAISAVLGRWPGYTARFTFAADGSLLPSGTSAARAFATEEYDLYIDDSWQITPTLTVNLGLRYGLNTPVNETLGFQVTPTVSLGTFFERRIAGSLAGNPLNDPITIDTAGPYYGKRGYYEMDKNNFMPRVSAAWTPSFENRFFKTLFGSKGKSVFRGGFAMAYDRVGSQLAVSFDSANTLGFNSTTAIAVNTYNVTTKLAPLFTGYNQDVRTLPGIDTPGKLTFPLSKPLDGARRIEAALDDSFVTPVNYSWNFSIGREFGSGLFLEAAYIGRKADNLFATRDILQPNNIVDPKSGQTFYDAARILLNHRKANTPVDQVAPIPFIENMFPKVASSGEWFIDPSLTPTQNALFWVSRDGLDIVDWTFFQDAWNSVGTIPNLFFHPQYAAFMTFGSIAESSYHAMTITARERFRESTTLDFNYTWSKSMDTASGLQDESLTGGGALIINPYNPEYSRSISDFDTQHIINANWLWELPFGKGKRWGGTMPAVLDAVAGGWSFNGIFRWNSGRPAADPFESGRWTTNWQISNNVERIRDPKVDPHKGGDQPNFWNDPQYAYNSFRDTYAGEVGDRNVYRRPSYVAFDFGLHKAFRMPWNESHRLVFRWEVFNATNTQRLDDSSTNGVGVDPEISPMRPNFGIITNIQGVPRVMQFGLRIEF